MFGVGAAFDFHAGRVRQAPRWMQRSGLEWLFRLASEPRRLGRRYLKNNPLFLWRILLQLLGLKKYPLDSQEFD
jgi:N-acetylglucosaminyldiphosphoundecaprenol N-acetyl-beta-D-mannosaminyltransferase